MYAIEGGKQSSGGAPGFVRLYHDVFERRPLQVVRPALRLLPGGRTEPLRRGCGRRVHLRVVVVDRR
jgi:hypothetical protein